MGFCGLLDVVVVVLAVPNEEAPDKGIGGRIIPLLALKNVSTFNRETKELGNFTYGIIVNRASQIGALNR